MAVGRVGEAPGLKAAALGGAPPPSVLRKCTTHSTRWKHGFPSGPERSSLMPTVPAAVAGSLEVDLSALPAPEETVFANSCSIIDYGLHLELFFWHHRPKGRTEPVLSVMVPIDAAVVYLWGTSREVQQQEESIYKAAGISIPEVSSAQLEVESPRILPANVFRIARTGVEASLELYFLPPYATFVAALRKAK